MPLPRNPFNRFWDRPGAALFAVAVVVALMLVVHPEFRALLLFANSLGLDLLTLLFLTQAKVIFYTSLPVAAQTVKSLCSVAFSIGSGAIRTYPRALTWRPFDRVICPTLVFITYGVRCGVTIN
jgi:hypothetical protein